MARYGPNIEIQDVTSLCGGRNGVYPRPLCGKVATSVRWQLRLSGRFSLVGGSALDGSFALLGSFPLSGNNIAVDEVDPLFRQAHFERFIEILGGSGGEPVDTERVHRYTE